MKRKRFALLLVALVLAPALPASAQTTTSSSTSTTSTSSTSTTSTSTTSTTTTSVPDDDQCPFVECTERPPDAFLGVARGEPEVKADLAGFCWQGLESAVCTTAIPPDQQFQRAPTLPVRRGAALSLRFASAMAPTQITVSRADRPGGPDVQSITVNPANPTQFTPDFPEGTYLVRISTRWAPGSAEYTVKLQVLGGPRPAQPTRAPSGVGLTG